MAIKYFKYVKSTLPAIQAGMVEIYAESSEHISKELLGKYEGLSVGFGLIPTFQTSWDQFRFQNAYGIYQQATNTCWVQTKGNPHIAQTIRHELLHACQRGSDIAMSEIETAAKTKTEKWREIVLSMKGGLYPEAKWEIETPVWVLQENEDICDYFINKYLK